VAGLEQGLQVGAVVGSWISRLEEVDRSQWLAHISDLKGDSAVRDIQNLPDDGHLYAAHVINDIWRATKGDAIVVSDVGQHQMWEAQYYHHDKPRTLITSGGLGTMGFALPAAIGAKLAMPEKEVWVVVGDGGFQMTMCELATIAQEQIDINVAIINNGYLGMIRQWQEFFYERRYAAAPLLNPDFAKLAEAFGLEGRTVTERKDVIPVVESARASRKISRSVSLTGTLADHALHAQALQPLDFAFSPSSTSRRMASERLGTGFCLARQASTSATIVRIGAAA